ncbi:alcohol dehydrogenase catalytic domain-containing protein [Jiangella muralis]|uniref:alcohol dehydrogenase catalytic domain-containing protein n=1 Tax=Jiangella muralis TaxID=702383 RepID=UPI000A44E7BE|nr:alcohol dehydrogenase catalytic domain-containing protein [Jiangella muralis]
MRALVLDRVHRFDLKELPTPDPGPDEVLVRVTAAGICGSELAGFTGTDGLRRPGLVFGHEFLGSVAAIGADVPTGGGLAVGATVTANPLLSCGRCRLCRLGSPQLCPSRRLLGGHVDGCNAEYVVVPAAALHVADHLADPAATVFAEPTACALHAVGLTRIEPGCSALVLGAGPIGLLILEVLRARGVGSLWFTERNDARAAAAEATGAVRLSHASTELAARVHERTDGLGVDAVFDAVGSSAMRLLAATLTRPGGDACFVGLHDADAVLPWRDLIRREVTCVGSFAYTPADFAAAVDALGRGDLEFRGEVVRAPLADGQAWYERLLAGHPASKVLLEPGAGADVV